VRPGLRTILAPAPAPWPGRALALLRIVAGLAYISFGTMKMFGVPASPVPIPPFSPFTELGVAAILEVLGGAAIVLGLMTRPVAFVLSGEMAVAYFQAHTPQSFWPSVNNGTPAILYCFLYLYLAVAGPGEWSMDRMLALSRAA
jgi:putative oxidoreductase